ncbi:hypothetical protein Ndes2437A_g08678 [Nannochloris sp. 'desiccata']
MSCSEQEEYQSADEGEESSNQMDIELRASGVAPTPASKQSASGDCYNSVSGSGEAGILNPIICRSWIDDTRPLSANQQQMWSVLPTEPQSSAYNMVFALHLTGALDNNALRTAVAAIMERHTILRMRFFESDEGIVLGNILDTSSMPSPLHVYPESIAISEVTAVLEKEKKRVLDLSKGTVLAACLHAVDDGSSLLVITLHHAAADFWSIGVFNRELSQLYNAAMQGGTFDLIALPIQYGDYAAWQQDYLQSEGAVKEKQFWKSTLAGVPAMLQLPTDRPRPESPTGEGRKFSGRLNAELVRQAAQFASQNHINMQSVLLAAVQVLLMRYSGQDDLVIGVPTAGRDHLETRGLIGYFVNTMPVMCQYMPKNDISQPKFAGLKMTEMRTGSLTQAKFDLAFHFSDGGEFAIEYMAELFDGATIERFAESLACLLTDALNNPVQSVFRLSMLGKEDLKLLQRFSKGAARPEFLAEPLVHQTFEVIVASSPSKTCLVYGENDLSCLEVNHRANRLAHWLIENGVKQETIVGVMVERSFDLIISILAILKSGGGYLPLDPSYPPERLAVYAEDAKAAIVLTQSHLLTNAAELGGDGALIKAIDTLDLDSYPVINPGIQIDSESTPDDNVHCYIVDANMALVPVGVPGELLLSGPRLAKGYIGRPDLTDEKFVPNPCYDMMASSLPTKLQDHYRIVYRTGDLVRWRTDGNLEFLGRIDRQTKVNGVRIELVKEYVADDGVHGIDGDDDEVSVAVKLAWREVFGGSISFGPSLDFFSQGGTSLDVMRANAAIADSLGLANSPATTLVYKTRTLEATIEGVRELYQSNKCKVGAGSAAGERKEWQNPSLTAEDWPDATRPLSAGQEQMWTLATLIEPEFTSAYVVGEAFRIVGSLDISKLQQALTLVASRHEVLRTRYAMVGKNRGLSGIVTMADVYKVNLRRVYLEKDEHRQLQEALRSEFSMPWDLEAGPLMRAALIQTPNSIAAVLCISLHHAVSDDWSLTVFCRELSVFYNFLSQETQPEGAQVPLEPLSVQYADFAAWQKKKSLSVKHNQLEYWRGVLKGAPPVLQLPTDHPRPIVPSLKGSTLSNLSLPPGLLQKLRNLASDLKISLAALTLAVYHTLLAKICDTNDVVVGVPVAQRGLSAVQPLVGYFITPVAVRASLDPKSPFKDVANAVQSGLAGAMDNSDISFQDIVQGLGLGSVKRSHTPVFQVMFNFTDDPELALNLSDSLEATRLPLPDLGTSQFELTMLLVAGEGSGSIQVEYFTSIFNASTVSGIVDNYISLLSSVVASPETPLRQLEMISESQRAELAAFSTGPDRKDFIYGPLVHEQFATRAAAAPKAPCLLFKGEVRTYGDVIAAVDQLAARLIKAGVVPFSVVGVMMPRSPALVIAMLATMKAGGVYLPLDTSLTPGRLAAYVKEGAPAVLLVAETTNVEAVMAALPPQLQKPSVLSGADVAALVFAAGPAGRPYGVEITHAGLRDLVGWTYNESIGTSIEDVYALTMAVSSSTNMATVLAALAAGAAVAILPPGEETNADAVASFCVSSKVTILEQSPMALEIYVPRLKAASSKLDIRAIILRGELPKTTLIAALKDALPFANENILSMYGNE